jgi:hypothetical protein
MAFATKEAMKFESGGHFTENALRGHEFGASIFGQPLFGGGQ